MSTVANDTKGGNVAANERYPERMTGTKPIPRIGNPGPLGVTSFASTTLLLSLINVSARGVNQPNIVVGMALFVGGLAQLLAGMWEFACGNTFGATAFTAYGAFWGSYASILIPGTGIGAALAAEPSQTNSALGMYLITWFIFTFIMFIGSLRRNLAFIALFFFLDITFLLLAIAKFQDSTAINTAGGWFGIITAFIAYYVGLAELLRPDDSWFTLPLFHVDKRRD